MGGRTGGGEDDCTRDESVRVSISMVERGYLQTVKVVLWMVR